MEIYDDEVEETVNDSFFSTMSKKDAIAARSKLRSQFQRDGKKYSKVSEHMAREVLQWALQMHNESADPRAVLRKKANALACSVIGVSLPVLNSLNISPVVSVQTGLRTGLAGGITDFKDIQININENAYDPSDIENVREFITMLKGILYHEGGHVLWSDPFTVTQDPDYKVNETFYTSPILAKAFPEIIKNHIPRPQLLFAWNVLEDQRMETAMCSVSPILAHYFTNIVINIVIDPNRLGANWALIAGRTYLPKQLRQDVYNSSFEYLAKANPSLSEDEIETVIANTTKCILKYRTALGRADMWKCVLELAEYMPMWTALSPKQKPVDTHEPPWGNYEKKDPSAIPAPPDHVMETREKSDPGEASDSSGGRKSPPREGTNTLNSYKRNDLVSDREVEQFISSVNENMAKKIMPDSTMRDMPNDSVARAIGVRDQMLSVLEQMTVQVDPSWRFGKEVGVLDPTSYTLREPGDTDYWSGLDDSGAAGHDLALSLLIDSSGSMSSDMDTVSEIAMGIRAACDQLDIPCTVTSFNDTVFSVLDADEATRFVAVSATGGTSPMHALMALNDQRMGKEYHLVVILTDGEWSGVESLIPWASPNRFFLLIGYGHGMEDILAKKHANQAVTITNLNQLEKLVTNSLVDYFAK